MSFSATRLVAVAMLALTASSWFVSIGWAANQHTLDFRLVQWRARHFHDPEKAESHFRALKSLGSEVTKERHGDHTDVRYRLTFWKTLVFESDEETHKWQEYLKGMGFETRHSH